MHELAVTRDLINIIIKESKHKHMNKVKRVVVELGSITSYKKESIQFYYDTLKKEHKTLSNSSITIEEVKAVIKCNNCKKESEVEDACLIYCSKCESTDVSIISGKDFILKEIEGI